MDVFVLLTRWGQEGGTASALPSVVRAQSTHGGVLTALLSLVRVVDNAMSVPTVLPLGYVVLLLRVYTCGGEDGCWMYR